MRPSAAPTAISVAILAERNLRRRAVRRPGMNQRRLRTPGARRLLKPGTDHAARGRPPGFGPDMRMAYFGLRVARTIKD
jgi:hypothetical protein